MSYRKLRESFNETKESSTVSITWIVNLLAVYRIIRRGSRKEVKGDMRLKYTFDKMELNDQIVAVPVGDNADDYHGVVKMNGTANAIFNLLAEDTTEEAIIEAMEKEYDVSKDILAADVKHYVQEFRKKGMLVE